MRSRALLCLVAVALVAAACTDDSSYSADSPSPGDSEWVEQETDETCTCADGSDFNYWTRDADPERVVLYFQGGGACFTEDMCSFTDGSYIPAVTDESDPSNGGGIFDFESPDNPLADWSVVYVPYCTGDVHIGNTTQTYGDITVEHNGFNNASKGLDHVVENFPDAVEVVVAGSSAGSIPSPMVGALVADELPDASVTVMADASGAYPSSPAINAGIGSLWGAFSIVPDWEVNEGLTPEEWGIPQLFVQAGLHRPDVRFARYDNAFDDVQQDFSSLAGFADRPLVDVIDDTAADIEAAGVPVSSYVAPGTDHTILLSDAFYDLEVEGVSFLDWFTRYVGGEDVDDVHCVDCGAPVA